MRTAMCDEAQAGLSAHFDEELDAAAQEWIAAHVADCADCSRFAASMTGVRHRLRLEPTDRVPDVSARVTATLRTRGAGRRQRKFEAITGARRPLLPRHAPRVAAAFVAGVLVGAAVIGVSRDRPTRLAAADLPERVVSAQRAITSLTAELTLVERGWHSDVPVRTFHGRVVYEAPESLSLDLRDDTRYPSPAWVPNDVALVVQDDVLWTKGTRACPTEAQPDCTPLEPLVEATIHREPFATTTPVPLDLITPVESLALAGRPVSLPDRQVDGRAALGVVGSVAQFEPLLAGLRPAG
ncbi:MAG: zf-HC2 domain-containing protein, partial [Acidimicrobiales bacterium]